jgi:hypothetical protein
MSSVKLFFPAAGAILMFAALAGNTQEPAARQAAQPDSMHQMSMGMMRQCMSHCHAMSGQMQELRSTVEQARESAAGADAGGA